MLFLLQSQKLSTLKYRLQMALHQKAGSCPWPKMELHSAQPQPHHHNRPTANAAPSNPYSNVTKPQLSASQYGKPEQPSHAATPNFYYSGSATNPIS